MILIPVVWLVSSRNQSLETAEISQSLPVETTVLEAADGYTTNRAYTGEWVAQRSSDLGFERSGKVTALLVDEGDVVAAGEPLARLDMRDLEVQHRQAEAGYWLPSTALIAGDRGLWSVYVLGKRGSTSYRVARRDVEVLYTESDPVQGGDRAFVRGLVEAGDRVITSGTHRIVADQLVQPEGE